jgi:glutathione S-transferase
MAVKLHRCAATFYKSDSHPCWRVEKALADQGIDYEVVKMFGLPRSRRTAVIAGTGQAKFPAIELEDGTWYREESEDMAARIRAGELFAGRSGEETPPAS